MGLPSYETEEQRRQREVRERAAAIFASVGANTPFEPYGVKGLPEPLPPPVASPVDPAPPPPPLSRPEPIDPRQQRIDQMARAAGRESAGQAAEGLARLPLPPPPPSRPQQEPSPLPPELATALEARRVATGRPRQPSIAQQAGALPPSMLRSPPEMGGPLREWEGPLGAGPSRDWSGPLAQPAPAAPETVSGWRGWGAAATRIAEAGGE